MRLLVFSRRRATICAACSVTVLVGLGAMLAASSSRAARVDGTRASTSSGTVYIESNSAAHDSNEILAFRYVNGVLSGRGIGRYSTGGSGSHDLSNSGVLDADQEVITNPKGTLLFAV